MTAIIDQIDPGKGYRLYKISYPYGSQIVKSGKFYLRIEDTDKERSNEKHKIQIINSLEWMGIKHDGGNHGCFIYVYLSSKKFAALMVNKLRTKNILVRGSWP